LDSGGFRCSSFTFVPGTTPRVARRLSRTAVFGAMKTIAAVVPIGTSMSRAMRGSTFFSKMLQHLPRGIGLPCGHFGGWPMNVQTRSTTRSVSVCSNSQADSSASSRSEPITSLKSTSASLWRRTMPRARSSPEGSRDSAGRSVTAPE